MSLPYQSLATFTTKSGCVLIYHSGYWLHFYEHTVKGLLLATLKYGESEMDLLEVRQALSPRQSGATTFAGKPTDMLIIIFSP